MQFTDKDLKEHLEELELDIKGLSSILEVDYETVRRWTIKIHPVPKNVSIILRSWVILKRNNLPWHPHLIYLPHNPNLSINLDKIIEECIYTGYKYLWCIDREKGIAQGGDNNCNIEINFNNLPEKHFYPITYSELGKNFSELELNMDYLKDAIYAYYSVDPYDRFARKEKDSSDKKTKNIKNKVKKEKE